MCFVSRPKSAVIPQKVEEPIERHQADARVTKLANNEPQGFKQNIRTSVIGLTDEANVQKKTLLGE